MPATPDLNVGSVDWPADPYGFEHHRECSQIAQRIGGTLGLEVGGDEWQLCRAVAMLHDIGRRAPWWMDDPDCARRSAGLARAVLLKDPNWKAMPDMIERAARVIAAHDLNGKPPTTDPIGKALWDADSLEAARLGPTEDRGVQELRKRYARLVTPWAQLREHQDRRIAFYRRDRQVTTAWTQG